MQNGNETLEKKKKWMHYELALERFHLPSFNYLMSFYSMKFLILFSSVVGRCEIEMMRKNMDVE